MSKKVNNHIIIVGGPIAAGKSSLVNKLSEELGWKALFELKEKNELQNIILKKLYEKNRLHTETIQFYFLTNRYANYKLIEQKKEKTVLDRSVWEDVIFAKLLMKKNPTSYLLFQKLWKNTVDKLVSDVGVPKAYVFLKINWQTFQKRLFNRGRPAEIANFAKNKTYFKKLLKEYNRTFLKVLNMWKIKTIVVDANDNLQVVVTKTLREIRKLT